MREANPISGNRIPNENNLVIKQHDEEKDGDFEDILTATLQEL